jgi:membrane protease YdiL (CAAX protease family)
MAALAAGIVAVDMLLACRLDSYNYSLHTEFRIVAILLAVAVYGLISRWNWPSLGLTLHLRQPLTYWVKAALALGGIVAVVALAAGAVALACGIDLHKYRLFSSPRQFWPWASYACLAPPVVEEGIYRFVLCVPLAALARPWAAIIGSGLVFAGLHVAYGNPGIDNAIAGFLLAWAFLKSGNLLVPIALHALGNLAVGLFQVAACYL